MKTKSLKSIALLIALLSSSAMPPLAAEAPTPDAALFTKLMTAIEKDEHATFVADSENAFQQMKKEQFDSIAAQMAPKFKAGYTITYLGDLKQRGYHLTLWKLSFKDGTDDVLTTLSVKGDKVGGFFLR